MGGELGSLVAARLEAQPWVGALVGIDADPPRRLLRRAEFHLLAPSKRDQIVDVIANFNPHVIVNISIWEPDARAHPRDAREFTAATTTAIMGAAAECPALEVFVQRSGIEVYGRARGSVTRPDETAPLRPTSGFGRMLADVERQANHLCRTAGVALGTLRLAPVLGGHVPSPLGRILRQPVVPYSALADAPFAVVADADAATAFVEAAARRLNEPLNIVATGGITALQATLRGRRIPLPLVGPQWRAAGRLSHILGAPIPDHVIELMQRGRLANGSRAADVLDFCPASTTTQVIDHLFDWESVVRVGATSEAVA